jgi:hypothetical protein
MSGGAIGGDHRGGGGEGPVEVAGTEGEPLAGGGLLLWWRVA